jgi:hypothetical protein
LLGGGGWELISSLLMFMSVVHTPEAVNPLAMFYGKNTSYSNTRQLQLYFPCNLGGCDTYRIISIGQGK